MQELDMNDFQHFDYEPGSRSNTPLMSIHFDHIIFSKAVLTQLHNPRVISIGFDPNGRRVVLQGLKKPGKGTINFPEDRKRQNFGIYTLERVQFIRAIMPEWKADSRFRVTGVYYEAKNAMVFSLRDAKPYTGGSGYRCSHRRAAAAQEK